MINAVSSTSSVAFEPEATATHAASTAAPAERARHAQPERRAPAAQYSTNDSAAASNARISVAIGGR